MVKKSRVSGDWSWTSFHGVSSTHSRRSQSHRRSHINLVHCRNWSCHELASDHNLPRKNIRLICAWTVLARLLEYYHSAASNAIQKSWTTSAMKRRQIFDPFGKCDFYYLPRYPFESYWLPIGCLNAAAQPPRLHRPPPFDKAWLGSSTSL